MHVLMASTPCDGRRIENSHLMGLVGRLGRHGRPADHLQLDDRGLMPQLLPWLAILALLALKPNRGWSAWWIWLPLAGLAAGWSLPATGIARLVQWIGPEALGMLLDVPLALAFGLAALWLLAPYLGRGHRFGAFLGMLAVLVVFIVFSFAATAGWGMGVEPHREPA